MKAKNVRSGFSMIELVFVIVILGVLAAVAVPRFVATRTDAQVATARSDLASTQKAIVAKIFADNIDSTQSQAPDPNAKAAGANYNIDWGDWIIEVAGLDGGRWKKGGAQITNPVTVPQNASIEPIGNTMVGTPGGGGSQSGRGGCAAMLGIVDGYMIFAPNNIKNANSYKLGSEKDFCVLLMKSYESSGGPGNKIVPLASSGTVEF